MSNIYIYPKEDYSILESPNPYVNNVEAALSKKHVIINQKPSKIGVLNMILFLFRTDIYFFNWIENLSQKRFGKSQTLLFFVFINIAKLFGKKIVWVLHNIYSHDKTNHQWTRMIFKLMVKKADLIITHSSGGVIFIKQTFPKHASKVHYIIHPVEKPFPVFTDADKKYDILIWGTIHQYKGVVEFLDFVKQSPFLANLKIIISGSCPNPELKKKLDMHINENIEHIDKFSDIKEIAQLTNQSFFTLFTYNSESVLSSGSLMDSIRMGALIIGPNRGAFNDLNTFSFIKTYNTYNDIVDICKNRINLNAQNIKEIEDFCNENSWEKFENKLFQASSNIF